MKKLWLVLAVGVALLVAPLAPVSARAGGLVGGGAHVTTGGATHIGRRSFYGGRGLRRGFGRGVYFGVPGAFIVALVVGLALAKRRQTTQTTPATQPLAADVAEDFETLFNAVEQAWSADDQDRLATLMTPKFFRKQKGILDRWQRQGKRNRVEDAVLLSAERVAASHGPLRIVVTAQARDYFELLGQPASVNQARRDETMLARFTEIWTLARAEDGRLLVANIRQAT